MSYEDFTLSPVGTVKVLTTVNGLLRFVKTSSHLWMIEYALRNEEPFKFTRFTTVCSQMEASCLYDQNSK